MDIANPLKIPRNGPFTIQVIDNGDVDQEDLELLEECISGPAVFLNGRDTCRRVDFDGDDDRDQ